MDKRILFRVTQTDLWHCVACINPLQNIFKIYLLFHSISTMEKCPNLSFCIRYTLLYSQCRYRCTYQFAGSVFLSTFRFRSETFAYSLEWGWSSVAPDLDQRVNGRITLPWSLKKMSGLRLLELTLVTTTLTGNNWTKNHQEYNCALSFFHPWVNTPCPGQWASAMVDVTGSVLPTHEFSHARGICSCTRGKLHCT